MDQPPFYNSIWQETAEGLWNSTKSKLYSLLERECGYKAYGELNELEDAVEIPLWLSIRNPIRDYIKDYKFFH